MVEVACWECCLVLLSEGHWWSIIAERHGQWQIVRHGCGFLYSDADDAKFLGKHAGIPDVSNDSATFSTFCSFGM